MCSLSLMFLFEFCNSMALGLDINFYLIFVFLRAIFPELSRVPQPRILHSQLNGKLVHERTPEIAVM
jgi:hypothetical protein